jgi:glyoxylate/hydroxypyruvate reductase
MSLLLVARHRDMTPFKEALERTDSNLDIETWPAVAQPERVQFAVSWRHPEHLFSSFPNLKVIASLGAGVDHLLTDETIPDHIRFTRTVIPSLADQMSDYVVSSTFNILRKTDLYFHQQQQGVWKTHQAYRKEDLTVGVMGLGQLGRHVAERLRDNGFTVNGWARSQKKIPGITTFQGEELQKFLNRSNIIVCLLPLTSETEGILDLNLFKQIRQPGFLINAGRGDQLVEEDLIYALDTGLISHAVLDVFSDEPLPGSHPFWGRKQITITPHVASMTDPDEAAALIAENYKRSLSGLELLHEVSRTDGY